MAVEMHITHYPSKIMRQEIPKNEWKTAVNAWTLWIQRVLSSDVFFEQMLDGPLLVFVGEYLDAHTPRKKERLEEDVLSIAEEALAEGVFIVLYRSFVSERFCKRILGIPFVLFDVCALFAFDSTACVFSSLETAYLYAEKEVLLHVLSVRDQFQARMDTLVGASDHALIQESAMHCVALQSLTVFIRLCFPATCVFLENENFLRSVAYLYHRGTAVDAMRSDLLSLVFTLLTSFLSRSKACSLIIKQFTWLYEQLSLETELLRDLVLNTTIVERFYEVDLFSDDIVSQLRTLKQNHKLKNVESAVDLNINPAVRRLSLITHIKDLFPDYGEGFIEACLKEYHDDLESVVSHILEDSFPPHIRMMDKKASRLDSVELQKEPSKVFPGQVNDLSSFLDVSKLYKGKKGYQTADAMLQDKLFVREHKQMILNLALLNEDDEKDDMYDDVSESSDLEYQDSTGFGKSVNEILYATYIVSPEIFDRSSQIRRSSGRIELRSKTGLSDEQIEGWKIMLDRNVPRQIEKIEDMLNFTRNKTLPSTKWSKGQSDKHNNDSFESQFLCIKGKKRTGRNGKIRSDVETSL
ncbi:hypothetical protein PORY_001968 [Pneumocystis oryctolagi]|uniref:Uncharacterized protein n=1 Tax=Pneumocystis oryctolagi TaxID=42067 RepID=A0ACB7CB06_9ASCO|nr:hypothetical protein PORY_001968 [Pneumocystis oryctolagi]